MPPFRIPRWTRLLALLIIYAGISPLPAFWPCAADEKNERPILKVNRCQDFDVDGRGKHEAWDKTPWVPLHPRKGARHDYQARFKMLYSETGVYVLFDGTDNQLTASMQADFEDLWNEDVYECFFWTDEELPLYFEYEISPLGFELPILIPNVNGDFLGWRPWHYEGPRRTKKAVSATGGPIAAMAKVDGWRAEVFIPYALLKPLSNVPPKPGSQWRANFYRVDYDDQQVTQWDWARVGSSFHDYRRFGTLQFE